MIPEDLRWPNWLPYPRFWLKAVILMPMVYGLFIAINIQPSEEKHIESAIFWGVYVLIYAMLHHKIIMQRKGWYPTDRSVWKAFYATIVLCVALMPPGILATTFGRVRYYSGYSIGIEIPESIAIIGLVLFLATAAWLFQIEYIFEKKLEERKKKQLEHEAIEKELTKMKKEIVEAKKKRLASLKRTTFPKKKKEEKVVLALVNIDGSKITKESDFRLLFTLK